MSAEIDDQVDYDVTPEDIEDQGEITVDDLDYDDEPEDTPEGQDDDQGDKDPDEDDSPEDGEDSDEVLQDDVVVTLEDGEAVNLSELKEGYYRKADYEQKLELLEGEKKGFEEKHQTYQQNAQKLESAYENLTGFLETLIPPEPSLDLARSNPGEYTHQQALRQQAIAELSAVYDGKKQANATVASLGQEQFAEMRAQANVKLVEAMPSLKDPVKKTAFDKNIMKTALDFGFTEQEVDATADHRILQMAHYARIGKIAEQNRKNAKRRITENPRRGSRPTNSSNSNNNSKYMKRLQQTGSIDDAAAIDFD